MSTQPIPDAKSDLTVSMNETVVTGEDIDRGDDDDIPIIDFSTLEANSPLTNMSTSIQEALMLLGNDISDKEFKLSTKSKKNADIRK